MTVRKWLAACLAALLLFGCFPALGEDGSTADLQESVVTREGDEVGSLADNLRFLVETLRNEEVRSLLSRDDIQELFSEVFVKAALWFYENRPVTMKVLAELDVSAKDRQTIGVIWDSVDRVRAAVNEYNLSGEGQQLLGELEAVVMDPELSSWLSGFRAVLESDGFLDRLFGGAPLPSPGEGDASFLSPDGENPLDETTWFGSVLIRFLLAVREADPDHEFLGSLLRSENLRKLMFHLSDSRSRLMPVIEREVKALSENPDVNELLLSTAAGISAFLTEQLGEEGSSPDPAESQP